MVSAGRYGLLQWAVGRLSLDSSATAVTKTLWDVVYFYSPKGDGDPAEENVSAFADFLCNAVAAVCPLLSPRQLTKVSYAVARLSEQAAAFRTCTLSGRAPAAAALSQRALDASVLAALKPRQAARLLYAFGKLCACQGMGTVAVTGSVFTANQFRLGRALVRRLFDVHSQATGPALTAQELSMAAWGLARLNAAVSPRVWWALAQALLAEGTLRQFRPQTTSNVAWAYATARANHTAIFEGLKVAMRRAGLRRFKPQEVANL
eukprot:EG_transcript_16983